MNKNGFIISVDAFLSMTLLAFIILISFFYLSTISLSSWNSVDLINMARDEATVLEKNSSFSNAVSIGSAEEILSNLNATPEKFCFEVSISRQGVSVPILGTKKSGCVKSFTELYSVQRTFVVKDTTNVYFYVAKIDVWYK